MSDCFFYTTKKDGEVYVVPICMGCHNEEPELGWFWNGSELGYGPYLFKCERCGVVIHEPEPVESK